MTLFKTFCIGEIGVDFGDAPFGTALKTKDYVDQGIPVVQGRNIKNGRFEWNNKLYVTPEKFLSLKKRSSCREGDLVFPKIGTIGIAAIMPRVEGHKEFLLSTNMMKMSVDKKIADIKYVYYFFQQDSVRAHIRSTAGGSSQPIFNFTTLKNYVIQLPSLATQRKIASILSAYDYLIENNLRRIRILEEVAQNLYREWFLKFRFPGHEKTHFVDSPLGKIPEGWEVKPIGDLLVHHISGGWGKEESDEKHTEPAYVIRGTDIPAVRQGKTETLPFRYHTASNLKSRRLSSGDLIFEVSGGSKDQPVGRALLVGDTTLREIDGEVICASFCKLMRPDQALVSCEHLFLHLLEIYGNGRIRKYQVQSTGISNLKFSYFVDNEMVVVPSQALRDAFDGQVKPLFQLVQSLGEKNQNLGQTRDLLLPKLISGEFDVSDLDMTIPEEAA